MITHDLVKELFIYDDGNLYWKINRTGTAKQGTKAGSINPTTGYMRVKVNGKQRLVHRIIYLFHHGVLPAILDHINGNILDNRIENLREATPAQNQYNAKLRKDNTSGIKGVTFRKSQKTWQVRVKINGVRKYIGDYKSLELAEIAATEARNKYHKEFAKHE